MWDRATSDLLTEKREMEVRVRYFKYWKLSSEHSIMKDIETKSDLEDLHAKVSEHVQTNLNKGDCKKTKMHRDS